MSDAGDIVQSIRDHRDGDLLRLALEIVFDAYADSRGEPVHVGHPVTLPNGLDVWVGSVDDLLTRLTEDTDQ